MAFTDDELETGAWCSQKDCTLKLDRLDEILGNDEQLLKRHIQAATEEAMSILRSRWPDEWPFVTVPTALRTKVAGLAVFSAMSSKALSGGALEIVEQLRLEAQAVRRWLNDVADSKAHLEFLEVQGRDRIGVVKPSTGEFGFTK